MNIPFSNLVIRLIGNVLKNAFSPLYCSNNGRPAHPIRLMCGLLILKHLRNVSDEMVVSQWSENAYYQYFCGGLEFMPKQPCDASELVHFINRSRSLHSYFSSCRMACIINLGIFTKTPLAALTIPALNSIEMTTFYNRF